MSDLDSAREAHRELGAELSMGAAVDVPSSTPRVKATRRYKGFRLGFWIAAGWMAVVTFFAVFASVLPFVKPYAKTYSECTDGPSVEHWLGCDNIGRDLFSRIAYGGQVSLFIGLTVVILSILVGGTIGLFAGYYRGRTDTVLGGLIDTILAVPPLILLLFVVIVLGQNLQNIVIAVGILAIPTTARIVRANTLVYSQREFVLAAKSLGARDRRILVREILPNIVPAMLTFALTLMAVLIIAEGALAFLGQSVPPPIPTWGKLVAEGQQDLANAWWISLLPATMMFVTILSFNIMGDVVAKRFDIREGVA